jgi:N utilization substance protein B
MKIDQPRPRTAARVAAVQALFQSEQGPENPEAVIDQFVRHRFGPGGYENGLVLEPHAKLFGRIVRAAAEQQETLDAMLIDALPQEWPLARLDPVLRALLRAGGAELAMKDAPAKVIINEYLDVAHGFFDGDEPKMANGLLDALARTLRPKEFQ